MSNHLINHVHSALSKTVTLQFQIIETMNNPIIDWKKVYNSRNLKNSGEYRIYDKEQKPFSHYAPAKSRWSEVPLFISKLSIFQSLFFWKVTETNILNEKKKKWKFHDLSNYYWTQSHFSISFKRKEINPFHQRLQQLEKNIYIYI